MRISHLRLRAEEARTGPGASQAGALQSGAGAVARRRGEDRDEGRKNKTGKALRCRCRCRKRALIIAARCAATHVPCSSQGHRQANFFFFETGGLASTVIFF